MLWTLPVSLSPVRRTKVIRGPAAAAGPRPAMTAPASLRTEITPSTNATSGVPGLIDPLVVLTLQFSLRPGRIVHGERLTDPLYRKVAAISLSEGQQDNEQVEEQAMNRC